MSGSVRISRSVLFWLLCIGAFCALSAPAALAQGFGSTKKKVVLHRKLPPTAHLSGSTFKVEVNAHGIQQDVPEDLKSMLETELMKDDARLRQDDRNPDTVIVCTVTQYSQPTPQSTTSQQYQLGSKKPQNVTVTRYTGLLTVSYQATDRHSGRTVDSANLTSKYDDEFDQGGSTSHGLMHTITGHVNSTIHGKGEADTPPSPAELKNKMLNDVVHQIASRLVNTDEGVEVLLARGKLDDWNNYAENARWSDYVEKLETMTPLPGKEDDAYRLYNIGVGYEAMGYAAEDQKAAKKNLQDAAINYGKAVDGKPSEKYFLQPQNRIETALVHYKQLQDQNSGTVSASAGSSSTSSDRGSASTKSSSTRSTHSASSSGSTQTASAKPPASSSTPAKPTGPPLTNEQVIKLVKANVDEENVIDTIRHAPAVNFDLSVDGVVNLANNGVKGKILTAMKSRARQTHP
ncbi:MAG: hypothetical protein P4M04_03735 [Acidobacteriota bacterium]|nr:hypothetical protein [Acidobacteriota bacterium]